MEHTLLTFEIPWSHLSLSTGDITDAMGYRNVDVPEPVQEATQESLAKAATMPPLAGGYRIVDQVKLDVEELIVNNVTLHTGKTIASQMKKIGKVAVFACTAGLGLETWSRELMAQGEFLQGYIVDAIASEAVERAMDRIQSRLREDMLGQGSGITQRYSPGYCGWSVAEQHALFSLLPEKFCGISLTDSALMMPIKSISGIIGIGKGAKEGAYQCGICEMTTCFRRKLR